MKQYYRLDFYVQKTQAAAVRNAVLEAGAGRIGQHTHCAWETLGQSQRMVSGEPGKLGNIMRSEEVKIEVLVSEEYLQAAVDALVEKHPSKDPIFCCFPVIIGSSDDAE